MNLIKNFFKKEAPINSYDDFWKWFQKNERTFFEAVKQEENVEKKFFEKLSPKLAELKEGFFFLTGMREDNTAELCITADGNIRNIAFVEELVGSAPNIPGWIFTALKPPMDMTDMCIEMAGYKFSDENISFYYTDIPDMPDEIDITIIHNELNDKNRDTISIGTNVFLNNYLGELNFATTIDNLKLIERSEATSEPISIGKLSDFLIWRQKEFVEKYDGVRHDTENDVYSSLEAELASGNMWLAIVNSTLLQWDSKASHPWILSIEIKYDGSNSNGMPDETTYQLLDEIEERVMEVLKDFDGYLNIGRETSEGVREVFFACKDFRKPSKVLSDVVRNYSSQIEISFDIYKDKYWQTCNRFSVH